MMVLLKRIGWGVGAVLVLLAAGFLSLVRVTVEPAKLQPRVAEWSAPPMIVANPALLPVAAPAPVTISFASGDPVPLILPVAGIRVRNLSDTWGQSRGGGTREHHAIDIMAPLGTPVLAATSGTVEKIHESVAGGHTIYVRSRDGMTVYYYAHLDTYGVAEKQQVAQGQQIATVGNTGSAAGGAPHLHFEIKAMAPGESWWKGTNVNPYPLLTQAAAH